MTSFDSPRHNIVTRILALAAVAIAATAIAAFSACDLGGEEGDRCNSLIVKDECNDGLHCTAVTCSESYCCPTSGASTEPVCQAPVGCPDVDAGDDDGGDDDGGTDASDAGRRCGLTALRPLRAPRESRLPT